MTLVKFNNKPISKPFFSDVFDSVFSDSFVSDRLTSKVPAVNIAENENEFHIELAAPGLKKEDFKINLDKNILAVSTDKKTENVEGEKKYNRREFTYSSFVRSFNLPESADHTNIAAEYVDGVLQIVVGKKEEAKIQSREISVK